MRVDKQKLLQELDRIVEQLKGMGAKRLILFGSLARDTARLKSDIDIVALFDDESNFKERTKAVYSRLDAKEGVDILAYNFKEFERMKNRPFFKHLLSYGKVIYES